MCSRKAPPAPKLYPLGTYPTKSTDPDWAKVVAVYNAAGLTVLLDPMTTPTGFVYDKGVAALGEDIDPAVALHDLAHWLSCPQGRRNRPNFGLGPHPTVTESGKCPSTLSQRKIDFEEAVASYVNVSLANALFGEMAAARVARFLSADYRPGDAERAKILYHCQRVPKAVLMALGVETLSPMW